MLWDTHTHAFGPPDRYRLISPRPYDPPAVTAADAMAMARSGGLDAVVWVHPSVYGMDNSATLDALAAYPETSRAVIALPTDTDQAALDRLHAAGVRGLRINLLAKGGTTLAALAAMDGEMRRLGWHVSAYLDAADAMTLDRLCEAVSVPVVLDHFGSIGKGSTASVTDPASWLAMLRWMHAGRVWVKISAPYSVAGDAPDYDSLLPLLRAMGQTAADQMIFASNWPHTGQAVRPDTRDMRNCLSRLLQLAGLDPMAVTVTNAQRLYA